MASLQKGLSDLLKLPDERKQPLDADRDADASGDAAGGSSARGADGPKEPWLLGFHVSL